MNEYGYNLANFIRDVRKEFNAPNLPFVVGELGMHGDLEGREKERWYPRVSQFRNIQRQVTLMSEFANNTIYVPTWPYVVNNNVTFNGEYHYFGRADTYYQIGKALARGALQLLDQQAEEKLEELTPNSSLRGGND